MVTVDILVTREGAQSTQKQEKNENFLFPEWKVPTETRLAIDQGVVFPAAGEEVGHQPPPAPLRSARHIHTRALCSVHRGPKWSLARNDDPAILHTGNCTWQTLYVMLKDLKCRKLFIRFMKTLVTGIESRWQNNCASYLNMNR